MAARSSSDAALQVIERGDFVLVSVGNATQPFDRLMGAVEALARRGALGAKSLVVQSGSSMPVPSAQANVATLPPDLFQRAVAGAALVICHAGAGTLMHVCQAGKRPVVMPRRFAHGEHIDDHQLELGRALAERGRVYLAVEAADLPAAVAAGFAAPKSVVAPSRPPLLDLIAQALEELAGPTTNVKAPRS